MKTLFQKALYPTDEAVKILREKAIENEYKTTRIGLMTFIANCDFPTEEKLYWQGVAITAAID